MDPKHDTEGHDERHWSRCAFCGTVEPDSRDHIPSRIFMDIPYPEQLGVVGACKECNGSFSMDEAYLACFIECAYKGGVDNIARDKIGKLLNRDEALRKRLIAASDISSPDGRLWNLELEAERAKNIVLKLARGHCAFSFYPVIDDAILEEPASVLFFSLCSLTPEERAIFEEVEPQTMLPEVGTRAANNVYVISPAINGTIMSEQGFLLFEYLGDWIEVQENRYRYAITSNRGTTVKIVIRDFFAAVVVWK